MGRFSVVALALSLTVGWAPCAWATLYAIPTTNLQIDFQNNSDPQYQLSDDEISQILQALSQYPRSQLAHLKVFEVLPSNQPNYPYPSINATSDTVLFYVPNLQTRSNSPPNYPGNVELMLNILAWNNLTPAQVQEWDTISNIAFPSDGQSVFLTDYSLWSENSAASMLNDLQTLKIWTYIRADFFLAALFTDWQTSLIYLYKPLSGTSGPTQMTTAPVTLTPTLWAFGNFKLFLSGKTVIGYQIGTADPVYWSTNNAQPLPSIVGSAQESDRPPGFIGFL